MKISKKVAQGMMIGGLVGMLGSAGASLYDLLTPEVAQENNNLGRMYMGFLSSFALFGIGSSIYNKRKIEESIPSMNFERYFKR